MLPKKQNCKLIYLAIFTYAEQDIYQKLSQSTPESHITVTRIKEMITD